jgi:hypothetical protein
MAFAAVTEEHKKQRNTEEMFSGKPPRVYRRPSGLGGKHLKRRQSLQQHLESEIAAIDGELKSMRRP